MRNYKIYLYITLGTTIFFLIIAFFATPYFIKNTTITLLDSEISAAKAETTQIAVVFSEGQISKTDKEKTIQGIQKAITNTHREDVYLSLINWSGKIVSHPDLTLIGAKIPDQDNNTSSIETIMSGEDLYKLIKNSKKDISLTINDDIIYMLSIPNTDLIVTAYINRKNIQLRIKETRTLFNTGFLIIGLFTLLFVLAIIRYISSYYEEQLALKTSTIEDSVLSLSKLNTSLENYQKNILEIRETQELNSNVSKKESGDDVIDTQEKSKQRLLTYVRNELLSISTDDISYIYVDNSITYVIKKDGRRSTTNDSLDQIYSSLDQGLFFRANRQIIVAIHAIEKITKFGNSALKIQTNPESEIEIIIGKNKAASFKQWLDL
ncbi:hypothetical protein DCS32_02445 [Dokdonia sp. Dokd-P16]|uniref:LytR/AlgR family response regulator transcription factor n=1 Tax=Dokdonia sp. Dokd-P16 TaxID=2173169 RepID=UPI000D54A9BF|nr:LytTR family DNA-binding domain-containing protein [Dokdonia sp. Dokd-P16]AWH73057.1 hypothetical protein DCS32_02445 [Dokdonia sp. Dokd-P16]